MSDEKKPNNLAGAISGEDNKDDNKPIIEKENANESKNDEAMVGEDNEDDEDNEDKNVKQIAVIDDKGALKAALGNKTKKNNGVKPNNNNKTLKKSLSNLSGETPTNNNDTNATETTNTTQTTTQTTTPSNIATNDSVEAPSETRTNDKENKDNKEKKTALNRLAMNLLNHQVVLKLFHFQTEHYGAHKASDAYLEKFAGTMDKFLEIAQGIYGKITLKKYGLTGSSHTDENIVKHLDGMLTYLREKIDDVLGEYTDLINVRDELAGDLEQLKYLLTFK